MNKEELLFNDIYNRTQDFGRTQFVREIMRLQRENKQLKDKVNQLETNRDEAILLIKHTPILNSKDVLEILERGKE